MLLVAQRGFGRPFSFENGITPVVDGLCWGLGSMLAASFVAVSVRLVETMSENLRLDVTCRTRVAHRARQLAVANRLLHA